MVVQVLLALPSSELGPTRFVATSRQDRRMHARTHRCTNVSKISIVIQALHTQSMNEHHNIIILYTMLQTIDTLRHVQCVDPQHSHFSKHN